MPLKAILLLQTLRGRKSSPIILDLTFRFFKSRLNVSADVYVRYTKDMLTNGASLPAVYGASVPKDECSRHAYSRLGNVGQLERPHSLFGARLLNTTVGVGIGDYKSVITKFDNPTKLTFRLL
jgi:hypothetical protein